MVVFNLQAQKGIIRGTVIEDATGEFLPGVTVFLEGTTTGTLSDLDGEFSLETDPGVYDLRISFISFETLIITKLEVKAGEVTFLDNLRLKETSFELTEVVVTAQQVRNTETALLTIKKKSANVIDGISSANFRKTGDSDAAASVKRVPGISVVGGKYVYVRGLGDRYTKTMLNGVDVPGLDPDRNTIQMDIFPTNIIDNIIVYKSFSADLPADFTGGVIDINIKDFPEERDADISFSVGYNPNYHFNSSYLTYNGGQTDWLAFDDGSRDIPATEDIPFFSQVVGDPNGPEGQRYQEILKSFNPTMAAFEKMSLMDFTLGTSFGNQFKLKKVSLGYEVAFSYKNNTEFYENAEFGSYGLYADPNIYEMELREFQKGNYGVQSVLISGMAGMAVKTQNSKYRFNLVYIQSGESTAGIFDYVSNDQGSVFKGFQHNLGWSERSLGNLLISGNHSISKSKWDIEWKISPTQSRLEDPDVRFTRYEDRDGNLSIGTEVGFPERIWRYLDEINIVGQLNLTKRFDLFSRESKLKFGGAYVYKERDFSILSYALNIRNVPLSGNPDELFFPENLWPRDGNVSSGTTYEARFIPTNPNQFNSNINNIAGYISYEFNPTKNLKAILGVRYENYVQRYTGQNQLGTKVLDNDVVLDNANFFPSINLVYNFKEKNNIRFSYAKTIARPSFKELSYAEIFDPVTSRTFIGGLFPDADLVSGVVYWDGNLISTDIHNFDLRYEIFLPHGQTFSIGGFYKSFINPIEIVQFSTQTSSFQPRNVGDGQVFGGEVEFRLSFAFLAESLKNLTLSSNITYTYSRIELSSTEYESKVANARTGETISNYRDMAGQAPYIINAGLAYSGTDNGFWNRFEAGIYYNVQGSTLLFVGIADRPNVYSKPFNSLNFNANKNFGPNYRYRIGLKVENMLISSKEQVFKSFNASDEYFTRLNPGITFKLSFSYSIF